MFLQQLLVDNGGKVNARAADGFAAMTAAAVGGYSQIVKVSLPHISSKQHGHEIADGTEL